MKTLGQRFSEEVLEPYIELLKSKYRFHATFDGAKRTWEEQLSTAELVNGPFLEQSVTYAPGSQLESLNLHPKVLSNLRSRLGNRPLWKHQEEAIGSVIEGKNVIVATGTSSGKTLCYQVPILNDLVKNPMKGLHAVIIYPLNALANDQLGEWEQLLSSSPEITFARFTGQTPKDQKEYEDKLHEAFKQSLQEKGISGQALQREVQANVAKQLKLDEAIPNRLNHREAIRSTPPQILITNFSMMEYILERPVDDTVFRDADLRFIVLDEVHSYQGIQATEIAFLLRRLKDRLRKGSVTCIGTSATLGDSADPKSREQVRRFASRLFQEEFDDGNPIYGTPVDPVLKLPSHRPSILQYRQALEALISAKNNDWISLLGAKCTEKDLASILEHDENVYQLRKEILTNPIRLNEAAEKLWAAEPDAKVGLESLLSLIASSGATLEGEELLSTRLHYFVKSQSGLHICLNPLCRDERGNPNFFVSRNSRSKDGVEEGFCPKCWGPDAKSNLVEIVSCRRCGYLYGALQDLGPRRAQSDDAIAPEFDMFSTDLGWASDSYWSYFSIDPELRPPAFVPDDDGDEAEYDPANVRWCFACGKSVDTGSHRCACNHPHTIRTLHVFHRQCPYTGKAKELDNLYKEDKKLLARCPNCQIRSSSGIEPVQRFQESDDSMGLAMAVPFSHFAIEDQVDNLAGSEKLLCFTDNRQKAAAFPSLLEEETFDLDLSREILKILGDRKRTISQIGELLSDHCDEESSEYNPHLFLPSSRYTDERPDTAALKKLWMAEAIAYFSIPEAARESLEDLGLVKVEYEFSSGLRMKPLSHAFSNVLSVYGLSEDESSELVQVLMRILRHRRAITMPPSIEPNLPAFGRNPRDVFCARSSKEARGAYGWLPANASRDSYVTEYLGKSLALGHEKAMSLAGKLWDLLVQNDVLIGKSGLYQLDHESIVVSRQEITYHCPVCQQMFSHSLHNRCLQRGCNGHLVQLSPRELNTNITTRWILGDTERAYFSLRSEEHSAQINKDIAKVIEDRFRFDGVDVLSSTTTFEMGINIGDLQKVLLRNAPPTSASYVQRIGRAGRGKNKNATCITLCSKSKYDSDVWLNPRMIMSGSVRPPVVFLENEIVAQRHFNAVVFSEFLRKCILVDPSPLPANKQQIPLEPFLPLNVRSDPKKIGWYDYPKYFCDFPHWLLSQTEKVIFCTDAGSELVTTLGGFTGAANHCLTQYRGVVEDIAAELMELSEEFASLTEQGYDGKDTRKAIRDLLSVDVIGTLAKRGFLPRYAFPLDVVSLETGTNRWSSNTDVQLSRDRAIAISEFAPSAQVVAHKKVFTSAGLYIASAKDEPEILFYSRCRNCKQLRTARTKDALLVSCTVCSQEMMGNEIYRYVEPKAFSIAHKDGNRVERYRRSTLIRQRQGITHFIENVPEEKFLERGRFKCALLERGSLFRYNLGPENKGFRICKSCGRSEPDRTYKAPASHYRLRGSSGGKCGYEYFGRTIAYGHQFASYCLVIRPKDLITNCESLAYALQKGVCKELELDSRDIGVTWRPFATGDFGLQFEVVLYDTTPGGAGFVAQATDQWNAIVEAAMAICWNCTCEKSCYDCLKSYSNQSYHDKLDRRTVVQLLQSS